MKLIKLKPCPFCGGEAKIVQTAGYNEDHNEPAIVGCEKCGIYFHSVFESKDLFHGRPTAEEYKAVDKEAIEAWNKRANPDVVYCDRCKNRSVCTRELQTSEGAYDYINCCDYGEPEDQ